MAQLLRALLLVMCLAAFGCGGTSTGYLPVDSPIMEFEPPDADELVEDEDEDEDEDDEDEEDDAEDVGAPAADPAADPAAQPTGKDAK